MDMNVAAAAELLDVKHPGWWTRVDPNTLDMSSCVACVLGQAIGYRDREWSWVDEVKALAGAGIDDVFFVLPMVQVFACPRYTDDWIEAIADRGARDIVEDYCANIEALVGICPQPMGWP